MQIDGKHDKIHLTVKTCVEKKCEISSRGSKKETTQRAPRPNSCPIPCTRPIYLVTKTRCDVRHSSFINHFKSHLFLFRSTGTNDITCLPTIKVKT